jgi:outer membrane protein OmpA-like peptidoglycan-associated protein
MTNPSTNQNPSLWGGMRSGVKVAIVGIPLFIVALVALYFFSPDVKHYVSRTVGGIQTESNVVDNKGAATAMLPLPSDKPTTKPMPVVNFMGYLWNTLAGWSAANGGPQTMEGSLMEKAGVNLRLIANPSFDRLKEAQLSALKEFHNGNNFPVSGAIGVWIMGDGAPYYISVIQQTIDNLYGPGKYHAKKLVGAGISYGEDKLIVPKEWLQDPQKMRGSVICTVVGDGDWVIVVNYAAQLGIPVNPDISAYDPNAVNFIQAEEADIVKASQMFIRSQKKGETYEFKLIKNGKRTNETVKRKIDAVSTWFPGDKVAFDGIGDGYVSAISTREYNNQMPNSLVVIDEWAQANSQLFEKMLVGLYTATNQIKQYDPWLRYATECNAKVFKMQDGAYWYRAFNGFTQTTPSGLEISIGGSRVFNYADAQQYYGLNGSASRYQAVYTQIAQYLDDLSPMGYKNDVKRTIPYDEAVDLTFMQNIASRMQSGAGKAYETDYTTNTGQIVTKGNFAITFRTGSAQIDEKGMTVVESIYRQLSFSEDLKVNIVGYTDNVGDDQMNLTLSNQRSESVKNALIARGVLRERFGEVYGRGEENPIASNDTETGRSQNRRVEIATTK